MQEHGIKARGKRRFVVTTDIKYKLPIAASLLQRNFTAPAPNQVWTGDITCIATNEGWLYLAVFLHLFSRQVVGWSMQPYMQSLLVTDALRMAWVRRAPNESVVFHPDRGNQYCGHAFQPALAGYQMKRSMSRKGDCWIIDNAALRSRIDNWFERMVIMTSVGECEDRISIKAFGADYKGEFPATDLNHTELEACCKVKLRITC